MKIIHKALAPLASLEVQKRFILNSTNDEYILPGELLEYAVNVLFEQNVVKFKETETLTELKKSIKACDIPENMDYSELILNYKPWEKVRVLSKKYLEEIGFNLSEWEQNEL